MTLKRLRQAVKNRERVSARFELSLLIDVELIDIREKFGRVDVLVQPVAGSGQKWISHDKIE